MSLVTILETSTSWSGFHRDLITYYQTNLSKAGKEFELFAKLYFLCEPSVRDEYKHVWLFNEVPLKVKQELGLGQKDYGIDLILEGYEGHLSVVQCKFKQDQSTFVSWSKDKLANMLADGDKADFFIIFTNASGIDKHTLSKKQSKLKAYTLGDLIQVSSATLHAMTSLLLNQQPTTPPKKQPKPYQAIAIDRTIKGFEHADRGQLILPCGAGKTLISLWIQERLNPQYTLVLFPSLALLRQTKNEWASNRQHYIPYICVCSEKDIDNGDSAHVHLYELSGNVSTDALEIRSYLINHPKAIVFSTYQSLSVVAEAIKDTNIVFDLALCDEAHKTAGSKKGTYGLVHDNANIRINKRLYMTATPRILGDNAKKQLNDEEVAYVADMSDIQTFGSELYHMNFKEAIDQGILVDYKIIAMGVSDAEIATLIKERKYIKDDVTADELANNYALEKFMAKYNSGHAITFHSSVDKAQRFQERHQDLFTDIEAFHVNGKQTTNERSVTLNAFAQEHKSIVTNARCLTEGVDVPAIDAVYFCDQKNSKIDIVQAAGRALRRADHLGKQLGYIVVPIFHRNRDKLEEAIEEGAFNNLVSVVRALSSHDERLVDEIRKIKMGKGQSKSQSEHLVIEGALNLITIEEMGDLSDRLFDQLVSKIRVPWRGFEEARAFARSLNLKNNIAWRNYCKSGNKPEDIPATPDYFYETQGWISWGDWLGSKNKKGDWKPYEEAREFVHALKLKNYKQWKEYCKCGDKPVDIPVHPPEVYKGQGWVDWGDWLGTGNVATALRKYRSFKESRDFVRSLNFKSFDQFKEYCKTCDKPKDIPANPQRVYKNEGWIGNGDWLGTRNVATALRKYRPFKEARDFVHILKLNNREEWSEYCKSGRNPEDIPAGPSRIYKNKGWGGWGDWLGTGNIASFLREYKSFEDARAFVHTMKLKNESEWREYSKSGRRPNDIPSNPNGTYKNNGWKGWGDWLGTKNKKGGWLLFEDARAFVHTLKLLNQSEWRDYCKSGLRPSDIPAMPSRVYKDKGWISLGDWLGKF